VGVIPWSPLRGGWLSGKYRRGMSAPPGETRISDAEKHNWGERWSIYANDRTWGVIDHLLAIAEETGRTPAQIALNWVLNRLGITSPIIGVRTMAHLEDNLGATGWALSAEQVGKLDQASDMPLPYPYNLLQE
jgi:aryl-alcohol dehydrogenase-like predicted oxidoreductase